MPRAHRPPCPVGPTDGLYRAAGACPPRRARVSGPAPRHATGDRPKTTRRSRRPGQQRARRAVPVAFLGRPRTPAAIPTGAGRTPAQHRPHTTWRRRAGTVCRELRAVGPPACGDPLRGSAGAVPDHSPTPWGTPREWSGTAPANGGAGRRDNGSGHYVPVKAPLRGAGTWWSRQDAAGPGTAAEQAEQMAQARWHDGGTAPDGA
jgi:hypothetical protein